MTPEKVIIKILKSVKISETINKNNSPPGFSPGFFKSMGDFCHVQHSYPCLNGFYGACAAKGVVLHRDHTKQCPLSELRMIVNGTALMRMSACYPRLNNDSLNFM